MEFHELADILNKLDQDGGGCVARNGHDILTINRSHLEGFHWVCLISGGVASQFSRPVNDIYLGDTIGVLGFDITKAAVNFDRSPMVRSNFDSFRHTHQRVDLSKDRKKCYVYFLEAKEVGLIKIGSTILPHKRFDELQTLSPVKLSCIKVIETTRKAERVLHSRFKHLRHHGEWFTATSELFEFITGFRG